MELRVGCILATTPSTFTNSAGAVHFLSSYRSEHSLSQYKGNQKPQGGARESSALRVWASGRVMSSSSHGSCGWRSSCGWFCPVSTRQETGIEIVEAYGSDTIKEGL